MMTHRVILLTSQSLTSILMTSHFSTCSDRLGTPREQILKEGTSTRCCDLMGTPENCGDPNVGADGKGAALLQGVTLAQSTHLDIKMK